MAAPTIVKICLFLLMPYHYYTRVRVRRENVPFIYLFVNYTSVPLKWDELNN